MEEIRKVAKAYFDGAQDAEKESARKWFQELDEDGDGKVTLTEYKRKVDSSFSREDLFKELDDNGNNTLEFEEFLALYYMDKVISIPKCNHCKGFLKGAYFSCLSCQTKGSYYLCCDCYCKCYGKREFTHQHSSSEFMDNRAMLKLLDEFLKKADKIADPPEYGGDQQMEMQKMANTRSPAGLNRSAARAVMGMMMEPLKASGKGLRRIFNEGTSKLSAAVNELSS